MLFEVFEAVLFAFVVFGEGDFVEGLIEGVIERLGGFEECASFELLDELGGLIFVESVGVANVDEFV